nr:MAG TPA: hypothetical protein [Caudoviricetes sp.]
MTQTKRSKPRTRNSKTLLRVWTIGPRVPTA